jgi:signal peptidase I
VEQENQNRAVEEAQLSGSAQPSLWREIAETVLPAAAIALVIYLFLGRTYSVDGQSMEPNLHNRQRLIVDLVSYRFRIPKRGEIIVFDTPNHASTTPLIKRVVAIAGDTIEIQEGGVYINGGRLDEPYLMEPTLGIFPLTLIPEEHVFVLGDNRNNANDSRAFGAVPLGNILGRAWVRYWPPADVGLLKVPLAFSTL